MMHRFFRAWAGLVLLLAGACLAQNPPPAPTPQEQFARALGTLIALVEPPADAPARTLTTTVLITEAQGLGDGLAGQKIELAFQAPDRCRIGATVEGRLLVLGRNGQELWVEAPQKQYGLLGRAGVPRFSTSPDQLDDSRLAPVKLPFPKEQLLLLPLLTQVEALPAETVDGRACQGLKVVPQPQTLEALKLPAGELRLWIRTNDALPVRIRLTTARGQALTLTFADLQVGEPWPAERWALPSPQGATVETVALSHVKRFVSAALSLFHQDLPTLGEARGERRVLATEGAGRLEEQDGTRVLFLKGSPEAMGRQHGVLMRAQVRDLVDKILYGVGVGSSFEKGRWFIAEIESAQRRLKPFMDPRYLDESDALAAAAGLEREEVRLANFFPELFHCSGFALFGKATVEGRLYHGRILDYMKGVGLEPNAVVTVRQPDAGYAWVNIGYAGLVGTVTVMNEKHISIGEMGGRGEGQWDGKPMAHLLREVMERAATLDEAIDLLRRGPRTCEYYYVVADGNTKRAVGVAATPTTFELIWPGQNHPRLPHAVPDAVLLSAGDRYETLTRRVQEQYGRIDATAARGLMTRPVAMDSNIHSALFAPETLDFWVANADARNVASHTRFTHYNLGALLRSAAAPGESSGAAKTTAAPQARN
jgi:outer membrane lipoprotein-sorting protein